MVSTENKNAYYGSIPTSEAETEAEPLKAMAMVDVTAPATLREGYKFIAVYEGIQFSVIVPAGGCVQGQTLTVPFNPNASTISQGAWKDDVFACTRYGIFHPSLLLACCCSPVLLGQVMTRLKLDVLGDPAPNGEWKGTFRTMVYIFVGYAILNLVLHPSDSYDYARGYAQSDPSVLYSALSFTFTVFMIYGVMKVRNSIRMRDQIPEEQCIGCEDLVCAAVCQCCTISQMARQTTDYDLKEGHFFTSDGLPPTLAPVIVV